VSDPVVVITAAEVRCTDGRLAATVDSVPIGGGTQTVTVDGTPEERTHESREAWHVRLLAPDRMLSDVLREADSYTAAIALGMEYARLLTAHGERIADLANDLRV
jgi:hypothetical protein